MMGYDRTYRVLDIIYECCVEFWLGEGNSDYAAHSKATKEIEELVTNPFSPLGDTLNPDAKAEFIKKNAWVG